MTHGAFGCSLDEGLPLRVLTGFEEEGSGVGVVVDGGGSTCAIIVLGLALDLGSSVQMGSSGFRS